MKIKEFFSDIKTWMGLVVFFVMAGVAFAGIVNLPKRVDKVEEKAKATDDKVQSVASTLEKYIEVQAKVDIEKEKSEKNEKELMMKWIEQVSKK